MINKLAREISQVSIKDSSFLLGMYYFNHENYTYFLIFSVIAY